MSFRDEMNKTLLQIPSARIVAGGREILMRCRECRDSSDPNNAHMYVKVGSEDEPYVYNCFKCGCKGMITTEKLLQWGVYDNTDILVQLSKYNKVILSMPKNRKYNNSIAYRLNNNFITEGRLSEVKLKYINNRLGSNLNYDDLLNLKIVLNLYDLLSTNNIQDLSRDQRIVEQLNSSFLGFISQDNAFVNMRRLVAEDKVAKSISKRYVNYNIFGKYDNTLRYFTIPTMVDLSFPQRIRLNIAEGPFDLLSIYYNLMGRQTRHCIYSSVLGSSYMNIIQFFIATMKLINLDIHLYADNDVDNYKLYYIAEMLQPYQIPLTIHRNIYPGEKDFGVSMDKIIDQAYIL